MNKTFLLNKIVSKTHQIKIQMLGGKPNLPCKLQSPHDYAQQNFRIFWAGMHFSGNVEDILWRASHVVQYF